MPKLSPQAIFSLVNQELDKFHSQNLKSVLAKGLLPPTCESRYYTTDAGEARGDIWIFFKLPDFDVSLAYSEEGYGDMDLRWGLVHTHNDQYGTSGGWYSTLEDMLVDSGYFNSEE